MDLDDELKSLSRMALKNAFYADLDDMVTRYMQAAEGLDMDLEELLEVGVPDGEVERPEHFLNIYGDWAATGMLSDLGTRPSCGYQSLAEAFEDTRAERIYVQGKRVFEKRGGEWHYVGDEHG